MITEDLREAIKSALRIPDCGHTHLSFPETDIEEILKSIRRAGYEIVRSRIE